MEKIDFLTCPRDLAQADALPGALAHALEILEIFVRDGGTDVDGVEFHE